MAKDFVGQEYVAATNGKGLHQDSPTTRVLTKLTICGTILVTVVSVAMIAFCVVFAMCPIIGTSMMTTLNASGENTDSAITCILGEPDRGDIIVSKLYLKNTRYVQYLREANQGDQTALIMLNELRKTYNRTDEGGDYMYIIKRLIAKAGDRISMTRTGDNYCLYLNDERLDENYLDPLVAQPSAMNYVQLWNVLNNQNDADMNDWVSVHYTSCLAPNTATTDGTTETSRYMLVIPADHYFLMGDNRGSANSEFNHSWDSTYLGPLPASNYVSQCVDVISNDSSLPAYLWDKFVYYVCFGWVWQK